MNTVKEKPQLNRNLKGKVKVMTLDEFNAKYAEKNHWLKEIADYDPEYDDVRYELFKKVTPDWTHVIAAFSTVEAAERFMKITEEQEKDFMDFISASTECF